MRLYRQQSRFCFTALAIIRLMIHVSKIFIDQLEGLIVFHNKFQVNGTCLKGLFHEEVVKSLKELPVEVCLVCARKVTGPSPLRGTIVDNVDPGRSEQAFASRVRKYFSSFRSMQQITQKGDCWSYPYFYLFKECFCDAFTEGYILSYLLFILDLKEVLN